jgi:allantoate deiminase
VTIQPAEMQALIETLGRIGEQPGGGIIRPVYSAAWVEARQQLSAWLTAAGLEVREDAVGNLFGRLAGDSPRTVLTGSHIDTVRLGGRYDGALGVLTALAAVRSLAGQGTPKKSVEVVALCEEEGSRFPSANFWGTRGMLGLIADHELESLVDADGVTIGDAMATVGLPPDRYREAVRHDLDAFVELHIEQGRIMYDAGVPLGVVKTITGLYRFLCVVEGQTDHAGTTPLDLRRDAFQAAAEMSLEMTRIVSSAGRPAVLTTGFWDVQPGAWNIVPGLVRFGVDLRHPVESTKQELARAIRAADERIAQQRRVQVSFEMVGDILPMDMDASVRGTLEAAADTLGVPYQHMISGAGHDSQVMGSRVPTAMLFVPSKDGRSHSAAEYTSPEDAARGASVLAEALRRLTLL